VGALGKVSQLEERYPHLQEGASTSRAATIGAPVAQLDVETAVKASQAVSGEIIPENLIKGLMEIAARRPSLRPYAAPQTAMRRSGHRLGEAVRGSPCRHASAPA
jgi:hypothetical protein